MSRFSPYEDNGGVGVAIVAGDTIVLGADTRVSKQYSIFARNASKILKITDKCYLVSAGQRSEIDTLHKYFKIQIKQYIFEHKREPSTEAIAQLLSTILYNRRFFPWYTFNVVAGFTSEGKGVVYGYDAIGSMTPSPFSTCGSGDMPAHSLLEMHFENEEDVLSEDAAIKTVLAAVAGSSEWDITTGDFAEIIAFNKEGKVTTEKKIPLN